jgi:tetratricopeptide (TPR) repeat protein
MKGKLIAVIVLGFLSTSLFAQDEKKYGETEEEQIECKKNLSLYKEFYDQKAYKEAKSPLMKAIKICPTSSKNMYIRGVNIYEHFVEKADKEGNAEMKAAYLDTLMMIYDKRIEAFGQRGYVLGRKGTDLLRHGSKEDYQEAYDILTEAYELRGDKMQPGALAAYYQSAYQLAARKQLPVEDLLALYPKLDAVVKANQNSKYKKAYNSAGKQLDKIFGAVASCEDLVNIYTPKFEENKQDTAVLEQIVNLFDKKSCTDEELYLMASVELDKMKPSADSKYGIGVGYLKKEEYKKAIDYLSKAVEKLEDNEKLLKAYEYIARAQNKQGNYPAAKQAALKMLEIDGSNGTAYLLIGDAYFYGSKSVGENVCEKAGGLWAAIPKYNRAASLDPSLKETAGKKIGYVKAQFPKKEDCFFHNMTEGQEFKVGGWINETVSVQVK